MCHVGGLALGICYIRQYVRDRREDWRETRNSIMTRVMLECEREYQEHLLLSVMPAYIAAEVTVTLVTLKLSLCKLIDEFQVKRSLMLKMTDSYLQQRQVSQFQDLFVQRHSNVRHKSEWENFH